MKIEKPVWNDEAFVICTKCANRESPISKTLWTADWAEKTKVSMKALLREKGASKNIRVMTGSCLGLCPDERQAILHHEKTSSGDLVEMLVLDPESQPREFEEHIHQCLVKKTR